MTTIPDDRSQAACNCCGETVSEDRLSRLACHPEVAICAGCASWLATRARPLVRAVPVLATGDLAASTAFWEAAGFEVERYGADFAVAQRDGVELHLDETRPSGRDRGAAYLHARDVDGVHAAWLAAGLPVTEPRDEPWDMREFNVVDPGGNRIRVGRSI